MVNEQILYWTKLRHGEWPMYVAATSKGICYIGSPNAVFDELESWARKQLQAYVLKEDEERLAPYTMEISAYIDGRRTTFTVACDLYGTPFQQQVWQELLELPYGQTISYSEVAERLGKPKSVRAIASAIGANPVLFVIPCHRVIAKNGSLGGFRAGLSVKKQLLALENSPLHS